MSLNAIYLKACFKIETSALYSVGKSMKADAAEFHQ